MQSADSMFVLNDPEGMYSREHMSYLLGKAAEQGYFNGGECIVQYITVAKLDRLLHGIYDC